MKYHGGKAKNGLGRAIPRLLEGWRAPGALILDVFCGALNISRHLAAPRMAVDLCLPLVVTLKATIAGWDPPETVTKAMHDDFRAHPNPWNPVTGFVLFGCSYGGQWGAGYARSKAAKDPRTLKGYAQEARRSLLKKAQECADLDIVCMDYRAIPRPPPMTVIYCDPPYRGTQGYAGVPPFDHEAFWRHAEWWHQCGALVFISEGEGARPMGPWVVYRQWGDLEGPLGCNRRTERLYVHRDSPMARGLEAHQVVVARK